MKEHEKTFFMNAAIVISIGVVFSFLAVYFDLFERFYEFSRIHEDWEIDEVVFALIGLLIGFAFLSLKNNRDLQSAYDKLEYAQQEIEESQERFSLAVDGAQDGIWDWNVRTGTCYYSRIFKKIIGFREGDFPNVIDSYYSLMSPEDCERFEDTVENLPQTETHFEFECLLKTKHAGQRTFKLVASVVRDERGKIVRMVGSIRDIQYRVEMQGALKTQVDRVEYILRRNPALIVGFDVSGNILSVNPKACEVSGFSREELLGENWWEIFFPGEEQEHYDALVSYFREAGEINNYEMLMNTKSGDKRMISWTSLNHYDENSQIDEIVGFGIDVTERNEFQGQLMAAIEEARRANRAKSDFLAGMSHEIRTPMNGVMGTASLLAETKLTKKQQGYVNIINSSGRNLLSIINEILDYSKIESGTLEIHNDPVALQQTVEESVYLLQSLAEDKGLTYKLEYCRELPEFVVTDETRVRQILTNLIGNAIKFTSEGTVNVEVRASKDKAHILFKVKDTGVGIPEDKIDNVFVPFEQIIESRKTAKTEGTGLGLAISKRLVEMMGGDIGVTSVSDEGATFWFKVPLQEASAPEIEAIKDSQKAEEGLAAVQFDARILVVEDVKTNQFVIMEMLERLGCKVDLVNNGQEAVDQVQKADYNTVLMDCNMPVMDGFEATKVIRELDITQPNIIALTANALEEDRKKCLDAGMDDFVAKPIDKKELIRALSEHIGEGRKTT